VDLSESRAYHTRYQVDEDDAKPVIDIEVDVRVILDERSQFRSTAYHRLRSKQSNRYTVRCNKCKRISVPISKFLTTVHCCIHGMTSLKRQKGLSDLESGYTGFSPRPKIAFFSTKCAVEISKCRPTLRIFEKMASVQ